MQTHTININWRQAALCSLLLGLHFGAPNGLSLAAEKSLPIRPFPAKRALQLDKSQAAIREKLAQALHEGQLLELGEAEFELSEKVTKTEDVLPECTFHISQGIALALEEYYQLELSYPDSVDQLITSGYLEPGWLSIGVNLVDFDIDFKDDALWTLVYVAEPIGLAELIQVPDGGCTKMRCHSEYSLMVPEKSRSHWLGSVSPLNTSWLQPFTEFGLIEITHLDHDEPGRSGCASCQ